MCHNAILASNPHWIFNCSQLSKYICGLALSVHIYTSKVAHAHCSKKQNTVYKYNSWVLPLHLLQKGLRKRKSLTKEIGISNKKSWQYWWYAFGQEKEVLNHLSVCLRLPGWSTGKKGQKAFITVLDNAFPFSWKWWEGLKQLPLPVMDIFAI